jgi:hypothetical protein
MPSASCRPSQAARAEGMSVLDDLSLQRFARQVLLPEIGERGQEALCATSAAVSGGDAGARTVCVEDLARAGVVTSGSPGVPVSVPSSTALLELAGADALREAAAWLAGSFAAVETIKRVVHAGRVAELPTAFSLGTETD